MRKKCKYYLLDMVLHEVNITSPSDQQFIKIPNNALPVLELTLNENGFELKKLHKLGSNFESQALLMFYQIWDYSENTTTHLSEDFIKKISHHVDNVINKITQKYHSFSSEDMITAVLGADLFEKFESDNVKVNITFQSYSSVKKEPVNGADLSFIFDINDKFGQRVVKTILIQSKKVDNLSKTNNKHPRLEGQIKKMQKITPESYVFLYSDRGFNAYKTSEKSEVKSISALFSDVLRCTSGDKNKPVVASSLGSKHVIGFLIEE